MREKADARKKAKEDAANGTTAPERKNTLGKVLEEEEKRIETGSQVPGAQLSFAE